MFGMLVDDTIPGKRESISLQSTATCRYIHVHVPTQTLMIIVQRRQMMNNRPYNKINDKKK